jgi:alpha-glucosidase (family GH31 glycosyl hydrolase)
MIVPFIFLFTIVGCFNEAWALPMCEDVYPRLKMSLSIHTKLQCSEKGGCWFDDDNACFFPNAVGYRYSEGKRSAHSFQGNLTLLRSSGALGPDVDHLNVDVSQESEARTHIKIYPSTADAWEIPDSIIPRPGAKNPKSTSSNVIMDAIPFSLKIERENQSIFELDHNLIFQEQYIEIILNTPSKLRKLYGFGESSRLQQSMEVDNSYTLWNSDVPAANFNTSLYGSHPFLIQLFEDGSASGVLLMNSNAMTATISSAADNLGTVGIQVAGGIIDLYVFSGPTPLDVVKQYQDVVGLPAFVPYWTLGLHSCRWGYSSLKEVEDVVANYSAASIPLETQWVDIDYMQDYLDFTTDAELFPVDEMKSFVDTLHAQDQYFVPIIDPGIYAGKDHSPYSAQIDGLADKIFVRDLTGENYFVGIVWPGVVYFPDWFAQNTTSYWVNQLTTFYKAVPYDGLWIDMNEVSNFADPLAKSQVCVVDETTARLSCKMVDENNKYDNPPWEPPVPGPLGGRTLPMSSIHTVTDAATGIQTIYPEYNTHNLHGLMESIATRKAVETNTQKRPFVLSRSTTLSSGRYTAHWTGDNAATWDDIKVSIITMKNLALFGIPMTGSDICGFSEVSTVDMYYDHFQLDR